MPKAKTKKNSFRLIKPKKLKFDKTFVFVFVAVSIIAGGYLFYQGSRAATYPPPPNQFTNITAYRSFPVKAKDSGGTAFCPPIRLLVLDGTASICVQAIHGGTSSVSGYFRMGYFTFTTGRFHPFQDFGWFTVPNGPAPNGNWLPDGNLFNNVKKIGLSYCTDGRMMLQVMGDSLTEFIYPYRYKVLLNWGPVIWKTSNGWFTRAAYMNYKTNACTNVGGSTPLPLLNQ